MDGIEMDFTVQILSVGVTTNNVYEVQLILAPEVDMSTVKITVKSSNLRVGVNTGSNASSEAIHGITSKKNLKHAENFLVPNFIDSERVCAVIDYHQRLLTLTAPPFNNLKDAQ